MAEKAGRVLGGAPYPLGATWNGHGTNFAVFAGGATGVDLCLFDSPAKAEVERIALPECTDGVWHGYVPHLRPGQLYGYRVHGPWKPELGIRYNGNKLLLDPYARRIAGTLRWSDALYAYRIGSRKDDLTFDRRDSAFAMPKAVVVEDHFDWGDDHSPRVPWSQTVIYEAHVRGLTKRLEGIPEHDRGTFGALGHDRTLEYLKSLGITTLELLPIHAFAQDRYLVEKSLSNYWGYSTLGFFAPEPKYLSDGTLGQIKWAVKRLHEAGIEVILDVVYNHTCEGSERGPSLSFRGFDNGAYYRLMPDDPRYLINDTGCGNTFNTSHPRAIQLVMDSLRYWVREFHIDGFRFDLCSTLGREPSGFDRGAGLFDAMMQDPTLARVKLIAEPWDVGPGGYQVGNHPAGMGEWNDRFRDDLRRFWKGDGGLRGALAGCLQGSAQMFDHDRRRPWASVNFVTAHDGFTLMDWASYSEKHNEANLEDNLDGSNDNESWNWGAEGPTSDPEILATRGRVRRAALATLLFSHGTPMLLSGDEYGHTQEGNNNTYCQDNELSWFDWDAAQSADGVAMRAFVTRLIALRRELRTLRTDYFQHGRRLVLTGVRDVEWFDETGKVMQQSDWHFWDGRLIAVRRAARIDAQRAEATLLLINGAGEPYTFHMPGPGLEWRRRIDSARPDEADGPIGSAEVEVLGRSVQLLSAVVMAPPPTVGAEDVAAQPEPAVAVPAAAPAPAPAPSAEPAVVDAPPVDQPAEAPV